MSGLIAVYLKDLARHLTSLPLEAEERKQILVQVEAHLLDALDREIEREGIPKEEAAERVLLRFGTAEEIAQGFRFSEEEREAPHPPDPPQKSEPVLKSSWDRLRLGMGGSSLWRRKPLWEQMFQTEKGGSTMWQRFTERSRRIIFFAQEEASRLGENYVGTEHLLLGLLREDDSAAGKILTNLGADFGEIRRHLMSVMAKGDGRTGQEMQLTPRAKRVIDLAYEEAQMLNNNYIGTEHLLIGLAREEEGLAHRVLDHFGLTTDPLRAEVVRVQTEETGSPMEDVPPGRT
jgi:hypothetical protein